MKIVDRVTFLAMPAGTVFQKYKPHIFKGLEVKGETWGNDFIAAPLAADGPWPLDCDSSEQRIERLLAMADEGVSSGPLDFDSTARDGCFDRDQLFGVWERADIEGLIARLQEALSEGYQSR